jgi:hypothetical protein
MAIQKLIEGKRGCGWRKVGGLYLVAPDESRECGRLPIPAETCPCCGRGIKPARGWTWVDGDELLRAAPECPLRGRTLCETCPIHDFVRHGIGRVGLIWIGERYYPTIDHFEREAKQMGISRRVKSVPKGFKLGKTWVMLAHRRAILKSPLEMGEEIEHSPGIFRIFKPTAIEIVVDEGYTDDDIEALEKRGLTPVMIERQEQEQEQLAIT